MKIFLLKYGYIFCLLIIVAILAINFMVLMHNINREKSMSCIGAYSGQLTVVLDAGHGGEDGGAVSLSGALEKDLNLAIALKTEQIMALCGIPPIMTRSSDEIEYPKNANRTRERKVADTKRRTALVNAIDNAVMISIHQNKYGTDTSPHGAQTFYAPTAGSEEFAALMQEIITQTLDPGNKRNIVKIPQSIYLLNNVDCPAILIECGFLSNIPECKLLETDSYQTKLAMAITSALFNSADMLIDIYYGDMNET